MCALLLCVPPVCAGALVCQSRCTQAICAMFCSECVGECVYVEFPGECDITQHGLLLGVLLLLPATPLLESMILHTHTLAPTEVTPTGPNFPLHLQPASRLSVPTVCLLASRLNQCSPQNFCLLQPLLFTTRQPIKTQTCSPPSTLVNRPITGCSSQEGSVTWVRAVALATGIVWAWRQSYR